MKFACPEQTADCLVVNRNCSKQKKVFVHGSLTKWLDLGSFDQDQSRSNISRAKISRNVLQFTSDVMYNPQGFKNKAITMEE